MSRIVPCRVISSGPGEGIVPAGEGGGPWRRRVARMPVVCPPPPIGLAGSKRAFFDRRREIPRGLVVDFLA